MSSFAQVRPGQKFTFPAEVYNAMLAAIKDYTAAQTGAMRSAALADSYVNFKNTTGIDLKRGDWVGLGDPFLTPDDPAPYGSLYAFFGGMQIFTGEALSVADHFEAGRFAYVVQHVPDGQSGRAKISGFAPTRMDVNSADDTFATIIDATPGKLSSQSSSSNIRIWWSQGAGTDKWALVELLRGGAGGASLSFVQATADGADGEVTAKTVVFKSDLTLTPNYEQTGEARALKYFKG